ncbi:MAG: redoxin domain-containing protein [Clostridia bacterium]|nr:redoxin domain-containing protein [Clostridia bacterium]
MNGSLLVIQGMTTFLEGLITFISPCVLPMLPVYVLYFTGGQARTSAWRTLLRALCFVTGFTALFVALGVFAGTLGTLLIRWQTAVNLVMGLVMIVFGLQYAGWLRISLLERTLKPDVKIEPKGYGACVLLGAVFAVGWSPCTGPFLGSAMMLAAGQGHVLSGMLLLLCYSLGLGVPFVLCALLIDRMKGAFALIKRHYALVNRVCGVFLIAVGLMMATGLYSRFSKFVAAMDMPFTLEAPVQAAQEPVAAATPAVSEMPETTAAPAATAAPQKTGEVAGPVFRNMAKNFTAYTGDGTAVSLKEKRGKPVVVNFFASWCSPCKMEMPYFEEFYQLYGDRVEFMMVNLCAFGNDSKEAAKKMIADGGYTFPVYFDTDGEAALGYSIRSMPTTIFVSAAGELKGQKIGMIDRETLQKTVEAMAAEVQ